MGYLSNEEKAEDNHSSAVVLCSIGSLGLVADVFVLLQNPFHMPLFNQYLSTGVMGTLFLLFIIMGVLSMRSYRHFHAEAQKEETLKDLIHNWCEENLTAEIIDGEIAGEAEEEERYYARTSYIREQITKKYMNLDEDSLDRFIDAYYSEIFDTEN